MKRASNIEVGQLLLPIGQEMPRQATLYVLKGEGNFPALLFGADTIFCPMISSTAD